MVQVLEGKRIVLAGSRKLDELTSLIERKGGIALVRSLQGLTTFAADEVAPGLRAVAEQGADWMVFTTGTGLEALLAQAEALGIRERFMLQIRQSEAAARGYKTIALLKKLGVSPKVTDEDGTMQGLLAALEPYDFEGRRVFVQLHGEPVPSLIEFLEKRGAIVQQMLPYRHTPPETEQVLGLCRDIVDGAVDAVCFTTAVQVKYLFDFAAQQSMVETLRRAFSERVVAVAVGKVTAEALRAAGVDRVLQPGNERMGAMVVELGAYFSES
ncbi:uroporphyrinogen-III synthase [Paenibacillus sp.]|uniref:uroporphyrinogen-III synthase n=1 Tax=Paenibacillus sp. TaxID=58172 RepID=UPI002D6F0806|nr:uroporphyrinogen-III synthase [Paenibacillus sp.]HZG88462.1 uroporphyrinogen-III synthase [Paenibacillus sp.]